MKLLKHLSLLPVFTIFAAIAAGPAKLAADSDSNSDSVVAIVSVDGFAGFYFEDEKAEMPNLEALSKEGVRASGLKVSTPSVTWPNHTTMITGVPPAVHGLVGNNDFDRKTNKARRIIGDASFDKQEIVHVPTLYDIAHGKGLKTAGVRWPGSRNAGTFNWTVPSTKASEAKPFTTYNLLEEATEAVGFDFEKKGRNDIWRTSLFNHILKTKRPELAILHISQTDGVQHRHGPRTPEAYDAIKEIDKRIGEIWETLKTEYPGRATLFIVSDHGFAPVDKMIHPNIAFKKSENLADSKIRIVTQGGSALVYLLEDENQEKTLRQIAEELDGLEGVASIVGTDRFEEYGIPTPEKFPHAPDLVLFADEGYAFSASAKGENPIKKREKRVGAHGHDPNLSNLEGIFIAWGSGIDSEAKLDLVENTRIAPTAAALLGFTLPEPAAPPLSEILEKR